MEPESTIALMGALKVAANASVAEFGKEVGKRSVSPVADFAKRLLLRVHMVHPNDSNPATRPASGQSPDLDRVELDPERVEDYAVALRRGAAEHADTARDVDRLIAMALDAGAIPAPALVTPDLVAPRIFENRTVEQLELTDAVASGLVVVTGRPGIGKTWLVRKWLVDLAGAKAFDVCVYLYLDDRGRELGIGEIARELLQRVGVDTKASRPSAEWVALWHSVTRGKRCCVVLDEVTQPGQVRPLLSPEPGSLLVAVAARPLTELAGEGAEFVQVGPFGTESAALLVRRLIGPGRTEAGAANAVDAADVDRIVGACDGIPAVLALAAGLAKQSSAARIADLLADQERSVQALRERADDRHIIDLVYDAVYEDLDAEVKRVYRAIGHLERADFQAGVLAALADLPEAKAVAVLETLRAKYIVTERWPEAGYRVGDMQRSHAREAAQRAGEFGVEERTAAAVRVQGMLVATVQEADAAASPGDPLRVPEREAGGGVFATAAAALEWVDAYREHLLACAESGDVEAVLRIAGGMWPYVTNFRCWDDGVWLYRRAADVARGAGFAEAEARNLCELSRCLLETGDKSGARVAVTRAAQIVADAPVRLRASVTEFVGLVELAEGEFERARELFVECERTHRSDRTRGVVGRGEVLALQMQGRALRWGGEFDGAAEVLTRALAALDERLAALREVDGGAPDEQRLRARLRMDLAEALLKGGRGGEAVGYLEEALPLLAAQKMAGDRYDAEVMLQRARGSR